MLQRQAVLDGPVGTQAGVGVPNTPLEVGRWPERLLLEAVRRAGRSPEGRMALVLHLSRLTRVGPRPHHRRVARAILDDTAQRHEGQVFALGNGDLVLLCRVADQARPPSARRQPALASPDPTALPDTMAALLHAELPDPARVTTVWPLQHELAALTAYATARMSESAPEEEPSPLGPGLAGQIAEVDAIAAVAESPVIAGLVQRQVGVLVPQPNPTSGPGGPPLLPLYREVGFSIAALEARAGAPGKAVADPFLFRYLTLRLDRRMLALLADVAGTGGALDIAGAGRGSLSWHLNLGLPAILSDGFARFARVSRSVGAAVGIEVPLVEACADPQAFAGARRAVADAGMTLVLDGVSHLALLLVRPGVFRAALVKLDWSPVMPDLPMQERLQVLVALERLGPDRVVLHRAESEAALRWGLAHGIRRFQGNHVDAVLAAGRSLGCPRSAGCTLRQCIERTAVVGPGGRTGCDAPMVPVGGSRA